MEPLVLDPGPGIPQGLRIPAADLHEQFARSSGPGGQGVNTTDSKVQLSLDLATTTALDEHLRRRALRQLDHRLAGTVLRVEVSTQRSQLRNRAEARRRLA
ncbi:peptide chain release factor-like protein, partial [Corynebacterium nasicanis]